jgi:asparagine synthase (glutamine-hydrolysing)
MLSSRLGKKIRKLRAWPGKLRFKLFALRHPEVASVIRRVMQHRLSYLEQGALMDLAAPVLENERTQVPGALIEAGCALGGSALVIAAAKSRERPFIVYDTFEMIPPPSENDGEDVQQRYRAITGGEAKGIRGGLYYGYETDLYEKVRASFAEAGLEAGENHVRLVKGLFEETMRVEEPVSLAHIDCDWYESVLTCLARIEPRLASGGTLILDDYYRWSGCRKAVDEYFAGKDPRRYRWIRKARLRIVKR